MTRENIKQNTSNQKQTNNLPSTMMMMQETEPHQQIPQVLSPCSSRTRRSYDSTNSPEFEFWMVRNPSFPEPNLLTADELFSDGVLLPLDHLLHQDLPHPFSDDPPPDPNPAEIEPEPSGSNHTDPEPGSVPELSVPAPTSSKRWKDIFKKSDRRISVDDSNWEKNKEKKKKGKKSGGGTGTGTGNNNAVSAAAELNINIWPFSRSRSAGNNGSRPRMAGANTTRKVSSAPCSRSNSSGESKSRKWPSSPSRGGGVYLGRSSPVWQVRHNGATIGKSVDMAVKNAENCGKKEGNSETSGGCGTGTTSSKAKVLSLNVPMCIGYRQQLSCKSDEISAISVAAASAVTGGVDAAGGGVQRGGGGDEGIRGSNSNLFNFRGIFTKKVIS